MPEGPEPGASQRSLESTKRWSWLNEAAHDVRDEMWMDRWLPPRLGRLLAPGLVVLAIFLFALVAALAFLT